MLKKCWITSITERLASITFESDEPEKEEKRLSTQMMIFPERPTPEDPLRHVVNLGLLSRDDLGKIRDTINSYLDK